METPPTIHDFGGFPQALYDTHYPAPGSPVLAQHLVELLAPVPVTLDKEAWGFDHGSWGVLIKMYPDADIPMVQLSIDSSKPAAWHFEMGRKLAALRDEGIMLVASGNVVHNLRTVKWHGDSSPYPWAMSFNEYVKANLTWQGAVEQHPLVNYLDHEGGALSNPTPGALSAVVVCLRCVGWAGANYHSGRWYRNGQPEYAVGADRLTITGWRMPSGIIDYSIKICG